MAAGKRTGEARTTGQCWSHQSKKIFPKTDSRGLDLELAAEILPKRRSSSECVVSCRAADPGSVFRRGHPQIVLSSSAPFDKQTNKHTHTHAHTHKHTLSLSLTHTHTHTHTHTPVHLLPLLPATQCSCHLFSLETSRSRVSGLWAELLSSSSHHLQCCTTIYTQPDGSNMLWLNFDMWATLISKS